jgi:pilus assembly protein CpaB
MRTGTMVSLGASAVLGIGALIVARVWLPQGHAPAAKPNTPAMQTVPVVVATGAIPYGAKLDPSRLAVEQLPVGDAPQGAYSSPSQLLSQPGGPPIALTPIAAREPLLPSQISGGGARPTVSAVIDEGMRAYTIGVTDVAGVGGHVLPGDRVDVVMTQDLPQKAPNGQNLCDCKRIIADVVLQNVKVLGMDLNADPTSVQAAVAHTATLQVSVEDAQKLAVAAQAGSLSLALRRTGSADVAPVRTIAIVDLHTGALRDLRSEVHRAFDAAAHHRGSSSTVQAPLMPIAPPTHSVTVVHGDTSSSVQVPTERFGGAGA